MVIMKMIIGYQKDPIMVQLLRAMSLAIALVSIAEDIIRYLIIPLN